MRDIIQEIVLGFKDQAILIVGDLMLDKTTKGVVKRISPEAPVPILEILEEKLGPGGAANVAVNIQSLFGKPHLIGILGKDHEGVLLRNTIHEGGIDTKGIYDTNVQTTVKERITSNSTQLLRIDTESETKLSEEIQTEIKNSIIEAIPKVSAIIISDYDKGMLTSEIANTIIKEAKKANKPVIVDTKSHKVEHYIGASVITLNETEAREITGDSHPEVTLYKKLKSAVLITRGSQDALLCTEIIQTIHNPPAMLIDKSGAGDTLSAILALSLASGADLPNAARIAMHAASIVITKPGVTSVSTDEILALFRHDISDFLRENIEVKQHTLDTQLSAIENLARSIIKVYQNKKKILIFGNGGSAADAQHFAAELVGRYKLERPGLPAIALTTDTSAITAIANDYGYDQIFSRQIEALAQPGDLVVGITTSGSSPNVLLAIEKAKEIGCESIGLTGRNGGSLKNVADSCIIVPSDNTPRIQETHITIIHIVCELLEKEMAPAWRKNE